MCVILGPLKSKTQPQIKCAKILLREIPEWVKWEGVRRKKKDGWAIRPSGPQIRSKSDSEWKGEWEKIGQKCPRVLCYLRKKHREPFSQLVSCQLSPTFPRNGLKSQSCSVISYSSPWEAWPRCKQGFWFQGKACRPLTNYSLCIWKALRFIFITTTSNFTLRWCQSQILSWLLPAGNLVSVSPTSSWNVKEVVLEPLFCQRAFNFLLELAVLPGPGHWGPVC